MGEDNHVKNSSQRIKMARRYRVSMRKKVNIPRVIAKVTAVTIALYVGNEVVNQIGSIVNTTYGPFNNGFKLIGWTVGDPLTNGTAGWFYDGSTSCVAGTVTQSGYPTTCVTDYSGAGVLSVIGVIAFASIVLEFVEFKM